MSRKTIRLAAFALLGGGLLTPTIAQDGPQVQIDRRDTQPPVSQIPARPGYGFENEATAPGYDWDLPIVPIAGQADARKIHFAHIDEGALEIYSSDIFIQRLQRRIPVYPEWTVSLRVETPYEAPRVFPAAGGWIVTEGSEGVWISNEEGVPLSPVLFAELGLKEIVEVRVAEDHFFLLGKGTDILGMEEEVIWMTPYSVAGPSENWSRLPTPPGNLQSFGWMVSNGRVIVAGGNEVGLGPSNLLFSHPVSGRADGWRELMYKLPDAPGRTRALAINSLAVVFPANPSLNAQGEWPLQRVHWAHDRADAGGTIDEWLTYTYDFPAPRNAVVFTIPDAQMLVFAGGIDGPTGEPNKTAYVRAARGTNAYRFLSNPPSLPTRTMLGTPIERRRQVTFAHYQTALKRARDEKKYHVVFVLDEETYNDEKSRMDFLRDTNVIAMLQDMVVSTPWPADLPAVRELIGTEEWPAVALLSPDGELLGTYEGIPKSPEMFKLLLPAWGPTAVAAPSYVPPLQ